MMSFELGGGGRAECTMYIQRGQENVRNRTPVKLFATVLNANKPGVSVRVGGGDFV